MGSGASPANNSRSNPSPPFVNWSMEDGQHFRDRARDCRNLAKSARNQTDAAMLEEIADELDAEADKIEAELHSK